MTQRMTQRRRPAGPPDRGEDEGGTRRRLLEAAGQVFAEKGFDRATGREICDRAGTNPAAVNYYFGGMKALYAAVLWEAHARLFTFEALAAAVSGKADARARLEALIGLIVRTLTGPSLSAWALRVLGREIVAPSPALDALREKEFLPKSRLLRAVVGELTGLPEDHPAVARGCVSVVAPCFMLLLFDRRTLKRAFPSLTLAPGDAPTLVRHLTQFALAGLAAVAREARGEHS
jgi:AcrR family transcriptional regulator